MNRARIALVCVALGAGCYTTPRTSWPDADFSTAGHGGGGGNTGGGAGGMAGGTGGAAGGAGGSTNCPAVPQIACSNACANLSNDGSNCGSCGHDCLGGTCSNGSCLPITLAKVQAATGAMGLALNSSTVFTTSPGNSAAAWSLYGVAKTAVNTSPTPILTAAVGNNRTGFLGANDTLLFAETGYKTALAATLRR